MTHNDHTHIMVLGIKHDRVINSIVQTFSIAMFDQLDNHGELTSQHALWMIRWLRDYGRSWATSPSHPVAVLIQDIGSGNVKKIEANIICELMNEFVEDSLLDGV